MWRASMAEVQPDPARRLAAVVLVTLATVGTAVAVVGLNATTAVAVGPARGGR